MSLLSVLTPTGNRQQAFSLCERYMARQTFQDFEWTVVDDGERATVCTMDQKVVRPEPRWRPGQPSSQARNLIVGLDRCNSDYIAIVEDDDYYGPDHLARVMQELKTNDLVGEHPALYYNIRHQAWREMGNKFHASMCQTAFRRIMIPIIQKVCQESEAYIDIRLWQRVSPVNRNLYWARNVIGIKGMPGRDGVSHLHRSNGLGWTEDTGFAKLREWIGEDVVNYEVLSPHSS